MKTFLKGLGIAYLAIGLLLVAVRFVQRNGVVGSLVNPWASSESTLGDVVLWPVTLARTDFDTRSK